MAHQQATVSELVARQAAWYTKAHPTFADPLAAVRRQLWVAIHSCMSDAEDHMQKLQHVVLERLTETLCYAA
jgi:hypothetical protein